MIALGFDYRIAAQVYKIQESWTREERLSRMNPPGPNHCQRLQRCHIKLDHDFMRFQDGMVRVRNNRDDDE